MQSISAPHDYTAHVKKIMYIYDLIIIYHYLKSSIMSEDVSPAIIHLIHLLL